MLKRLSGMWRRHDIVRAFLGTSAVSAFARLAQLGMAILLARALEPELYGSFVFATGAALLGGRIGSLGWPVLMMRFIPAYTETQDWARLRGLLAQSVWVVGAGGLLGGACVGAIAWALGPAHHLYYGLILAALFLPFMAFQALRRNQLAGLKKPAQAILINEFLPPVIVVVIAYVIGIDGLSTVGAAYLFANLVGVGVGAVLVARGLPDQVRKTAPAGDFRVWMTTALPALVGMSALLLMNKTDILMLGPLSTLTEVGYYGAAQRLTYLQTAPVMILSVVLSPRLSRARAAGNLKQVRRLFFGALAFAGGMSIPAGAILLFGRDPIIGWLFGAAYAPAAPVLAVLVLSQVAAALTVPTTSLLLMSGEQNRFGVVMGVALATNVGLNVWLVPAYGAVGAAIATTVVMVLLFAVQCRTALAAAQDPAAPPR